MLFFLYVFSFVGCLCCVFSFDCLVVSLFAFAVGCLLIVCVLSVLLFVCCLIVVLA